MLVEYHQQQQQQQQPGAAATAAQPGLVWFGLVLAWLGLAFGWPSVGRWAVDLSTGVKKANGQGSSPPSLPPSLPAFLPSFLLPSSGSKFFSNFLKLVLP